MSRKLGASDTEHFGVETISDARGDHRRIACIVANGVTLDPVERGIKLTIGRVIGNRAFGATGRTCCAHRLAGTKHDIIEIQVLPFNYPLSSLKKPWRNREIQDHLVSVERIR